MIRFADIPEHITDIPKKIYNDLINTPQEVRDIAKEWRDMVNDMHNLKSNLSDINDFMQGFTNAFEWVVDLFNTPLYDLLDAIALPGAYLLIVGGLIIMMFSRRWGNRLVKFGGIGFLVAQVLLAIQRGIS